jgi:hypothetical protein
MYSPFNQFLSPLFSQFAPMAPLTFPTHQQLKPGSPLFPRRAMFQPLMRSRPDEFEARPISPSIKLSHIGTAWRN